MYLIDCWLGCITSWLIGAATVMWPLGLSSDVGGSVLIWFRWGLMRAYWQADTSQSPTPLSVDLGLKLSATEPKHILPSMCQGKAIKTALLFLSIMRISTRFSEILPGALKILGIFPLKRFLMGRSEVSETLVRLECFGISVYLFAAETTKI